MMSSIKKDRDILDKIFYVIIEEKKTLGNKFVFERVLIFNWVSNLEVKTSGVVELVKKLLADIQCHIENFTRRGLVKKNIKK